MKLVFAVCTFNRSTRLPRLLSEMRKQHCPIPFDILVINNNSTDNSLQILQKIAEQPGPKVKIVNEEQQGIVAARNRALSEALHDDILVFIDDDELPHAGLLDAACDAILNQKAQCAGGRVSVDFANQLQPRWLTSELLGFLAAVDHGPESFWIKDSSTPIWTSNIAYDVSLFRDHPELRFDNRYDRLGNKIGGGSDAVMFRELLARSIKLQYRPDMAVDHFVESWRLKRFYFLQLHYRAGVRKGQFELPDFPNKIFGVPPFLISQLFKHSSTCVAMVFKVQNTILRQAMTASNTLGMIVGYKRRRGRVSFDADTSS